MVQNPQNGTENGTEDLVQQWYRMNSIQTPKSLILILSPVSIVRVRVPLSAHNISDLDQEKADTNIHIPNNRHTK